MVEFENEFPQFLREGATRRATFDPSVAMDHEDVEFLAVGHEIVDALLARARSSSYGGRTSIRRRRTNDRDPIKGWFFTFVLEFEAVQSLKEVLPVFVASGGVANPELATWLLDRSLRIKREDLGLQELPERDEAFDQAVQAANEVSLEQLMARQAELEVVNRERVALERQKLERFYSYKQMAAEEKVAAVGRTVERLDSSDDPDVQRILPVPA